MKYITFAVPCYNSESYMRKCLDSLLLAGNDAEIIIVNDGSSDGTAAIADEYVLKYPGIVRAVHKENGGHGSGVNTGLERAEGLYFKVVDSDDWVDADSLKELLTLIKDRHSRDEDVDLYLCNYVYEHVADNTQYSVNYKNVFPQNREFGWQDTKHFHASQFMTMHSMIYKTELLRRCELELPKHTFYVDNIFIVHPLPLVRTMYYIDTDFYRYFIGRSDQSVNEAVILKRIGQQKLVADILIDDYVKQKDSIESPKLRRYIIRHLGILGTIVSVFLAMKNTKESMAERREFWQRIRRLDKELYKKVRYTTPAWVVSMPTAFGRFAAIVGYRVTQKLYKYN